MNSLGSEIEKARVALFNNRPENATQQELQEWQAGLAYLDNLRTQIEIAIGRVNRDGADPIEITQVIGGNLVHTSSSDNVRLASVISNVIPAGGVLASIAGGIKSASKIGIGHNRQPKYIYSARVLKRSADANDTNHNFPMSFDLTVINKGKLVIENGAYKQYNLRGTLNGRTGVYEIGYRGHGSGVNNAITHRFFRPD